MNCDLIEGSEPLMEWKVQCAEPAAGRMINACDDRVQWIKPAMAVRSDAAAKTWPDLTFYYM